MKRKRAVSEKKYSPARERALFLPVRKREDRTSILCHGATRECRIPRACNDSRFDILKTHSERDRNEQKEPSTNRYVFVSEHWLLHERKRFICVRRNRVWSTSRLRRGGWRQKERVLFDSKRVERRKVLLWEQSSSHLAAVSSEFREHVRFGVRRVQRVGDLWRMEMFKISQTGFFATAPATSIGWIVSTISSFATKFSNFLRNSSSENRNRGCLLHRFAKSWLSAQSKMRQTSVFEREFWRQKPSEFAFEMLRANRSSQQRVMLLWRTISKSHERQRTQI